MPVTNVTSEQLTKELQLLVAQHHFSFLDAVLYYCDQRKIDPEDIAVRLGDKIKSELAREARRLHLLQGGAEELF